MFIWKKDFMALVAEKAAALAQVSVLSIDNARLEANEDKLANSLASVRRDFELCCDRSLKLEAVVLKLQDRITSEQMSKSVKRSEEENMDIFAEDPEDIQSVVNDIHKYGRDAVIVREA